MDYPRRAYQGPVQHSTPKQSILRSSTVNHSRKMTYREVRFTSPPSVAMWNTTYRGDETSRRSRPFVQLRYKTELCKAFEENKLCQFGIDCTFAHGFAELRAVSYHPKYKSEPCRSFHSTGFCSYGVRCHFIHNPCDVGGVSPSGRYLIQKHKRDLVTRMAQTGDNSGALAPNTYTVPLTNQRQVLRDTARAVAVILRQLNQMSLASSPTLKRENARPCS